MKIFQSLIPKTPKNSLFHCMLVKLFSQDVLIYGTKSPILCCSEPPYRSFPQLSLIYTQYFSFYCSAINQLFANHSKFSINCAFGTIKGGSAGKGLLLKFIKLFQTSFQISASKIFALLFLTYLDTIWRESDLK